MILFAWMADQNYGVKEKKLEDYSALAACSSPEMAITPSITNDLETSKDILNDVRIVSFTILAMDLFYLVALGCFIAKHKV